MQIIKDYKEFVRRILFSIKHFNSPFLVFIGAGCSKSSGVPTASELAIDILKILKYFEIGDTIEFNNWLRGKYPNLDIKNVSLIYPEVIEKTFLFNSEISKLIKKIIRDKLPSAGYQKFANLIANNTHAKMLNCVITLNFDMLLERALLSASKSTKVYNLNYENIDRIVRDYPCIIYAQGDVNHFNDYRAPKSFNSSIIRALSDLTEINILFLGYGGNDKTVLGMLKEIPAELLGTIYWVNKDLPINPDMSEWLQQNNSAWVDHSDFDQLMDYMWEEFEKKSLDNKDVMLENFQRILLKGGIIGEREQLNSLIQLIKKEKNGNIIERIIETLSESSGGPVSIQKIIEMFNSYNHDSLIDGIA